MNTIAFLLLFVLVVVSQAAPVPCFYHWTRAQNGTSGTQTFTGIVLTATTETYNNPLYYSLSAAQTGFASTTNVAKGRLSAALPTTTFKGTMTFDFFKGKDQITIDFTKANNGGPILKGKGCYAKIKGNATRVQIGTTLPKVFEWKFCPLKKPKCVPK